MEKYNERRIEAWYTFWPLHRLYSICIGETKYTKEEREKHDRDFEKILKTYKILGENETIKHEE